MRRRTEEAVVPAFLAADFTGVFVVLATVFGAGLPMLDRYRFFFGFVTGAVVFVGAGTDAPKHTPSEASAATPTLKNEIIP
jgi:hypothetical protein